MRLVPLTLSALLLASTAHAAPLSAADKVKIDRAVEAVLKQSNTPSASIAVVKDGQIAYVHAYGLARLKPALKATPATRYQIASVSKEIVAAAALLLQQDGKLSLDDKVSKWLPDLTAADQITLRQCLTHTAGYSDFWPQDYQMAPMYKATTVNQILADWAKKPLDFKPGTDWQYSNTGYVVAGAIIEKAAGMPLFDYVNTRIFKPLGITDALSVDKVDLKVPDAMGYDRAALGTQRLQGPAGAGWMFSAASFALTAEDMVRWDLSLLNHSLLSPESYKQELETAKLASGRDTHYALGLTVTTRNDRLRIEHSGEGSGYHAENRIYPDDHAAVAVLVNTFSGRPENDIADAIDYVVLAPKGLDPKVRALFVGLQHGQVDRSAFTDNFNAYLDRGTVAEYRRTLAPLGDPTSVRQTSSSDRGGMKFYAYRIVAGGKPLDLSIYQTKDGKIEQFLVTAVTS